MKIFTLNKKPYRAERPQQAEVRSVSSFTKDFEEYSNKISTIARSPRSIAASNGVLAYYIVVQKQLSEAQLNGGLE